jgi:hypothetical protein
MKRKEKSPNRHYQLLITALLVGWLLPGVASVDTEQHSATLPIITDSSLVKELDSGLAVERKTIKKHKSCVEGGPCDRSRTLKKASKSNKRGMLVLALALGVGSER